MMPETKKYNFYYYDFLGIERVVSTSGNSLFNALKSVPYKKVMRVYKCYINDKPVPETYLYKNLGRVEKWHEKLKEL